LFGSGLKKRVERFHRPLNHTEVFSAPSRTSLKLAKRGIAFGLVEAHSAVRDMLRVEGVEKKAGRIDRFTTLADAIEDFQNGAAPKS
jgi:hypothetical protein